MEKLVMGLILLVIAIVLFVIKVPKPLTQIKKIVGSLLGLAAVVMIVFAGFDYNDTGRTKHIRTIFGTENAVFNTGWYFSGWGKTTNWMHEYTVSHVQNPAEMQGTSVNGLYTIRMADNWRGKVSQTTRFRMPQDKEQFLKMARVFRSPESIVTKLLRPVVTESLDSTGNMFTMEEYYVKNRRTDFKDEFHRTLQFGRPTIVRSERQVEVTGLELANPEATELDATAEAGTAGRPTQRVVVVEVAKDASGNEIRTPYGYVDYGITVSYSVVDDLLPDAKFEEQIEKRKKAAADKLNAIEQSVLAEEERKLAIKQGNTEIAKAQALAEAEQIRITTDAETKRQEAQIKAQQLLDRARIDLETSKIELERAEVDAERIQVSADAEAYQKQVILEADGQLLAKLDAYVKVQQAWADAASKINVPQTMFVSGGGDAGPGDGGTINGNAFGTIEQFLQLMVAKSAQDLVIDTSVRGHNEPQ